MNFMASLQKVGKAMMTPVAVLPAAALLLRFGQPDLLNIPAMAQAGAAIFDNMALLFAIGVAIGLASDSGVAGLSGMVAYFVITKTAVTINKDINMGVLAGIIAGVLAAEMFKRFKDTKLPDYLGFFGGRRFV
ncbi:MAG TPA: PTS transporter subunit EIIC, partial [Symbiobacteriaceae bacterium]|nr:PTS transporter subunit EIIC [Symbiobacteriaceae bacterium]